MSDWLPLSSGPLMHSYLFISTPTTTIFGHTSIGEMELLLVPPDHLLMVFLTGKMKGLACLAVTKREIHAVVPLRGRTRQRARAAAGAHWPDICKVQRLLLTLKEGWGPGAQADGEHLTVHKMQRFPLLSHTG